MLLDDIKTVVCEIRQSSFEVENPSIHTLGEDVGYSRSKSYPEINFVSDLKQGLMAMADYEAQNLLVQVELYKRIQERHFDDCTFRETREQLIKNRRAIIPDLVIHENQSNQRHQVLALECKIAPNLSYADFCIDLFKLMMFKEVFSFEHLVFVIANIGSTDIQDYYESYQADDFYLSNSNLHILVKQNANSPIVCINHPDGNC